MNDDNEKHKPSSVMCVVCGAQSGIDCIEVFGLIAGIEGGCYACIGVTHFPDLDEMGRRLTKAPEQTNPYAS